MPGGCAVGGELVTVIAGETGRVEEPGAGATLDFAVAESFGGRIVAWGVEVAVPDAEACEPALELGGD